MQLIEILLVYFMATIGQVKMYLRKLGNPFMQRITFWGNCTINWKIKINGNYNITVHSYTPFAEQKKTYWKTLFRLYKIFSEIYVSPEILSAFVDPFTSKIYMYLMKNTNLLKKKTEHFNNDISKTRDSNQKMRIQTDQKFQENKINSIQNIMLKCSA